MCICKICNIEFEANPKWKHKTGFCSDVCRREGSNRTKRKYKKSKKGRASEARWRNNPKKKEIDRKYMQTPSAKAKAVVRSKRALANSPILREKKRKYDREYAKTENGKKLNKKARRKYRSTEKGKITNKRNKAARRGADGNFTFEEWKDKLQRYDGRCAYCRTKDQIQIDHIIPISKGGTNNIDNLQPLCRSCNASKGDKIEDKMLMRV